MVRSLHHVAICLLGNSKGEGGANYHTINVVDESMSGLQMMWWVEKLVSIADQEGRSWGPAFANANGSLAVGSKFDTVFRKYLKQVQDKTSWISGDANINVFFSLSCTPRKYVLTRSRRYNLVRKYLYSINWWMTIESATGRRSRFNIHQRYSKVYSLIPTTFFYSYAL